MAGANATKSWPGPPRGVLAIKVQSYFSTSRTLAKGATAGETSFAALLVVKKLADKLSGVHRVRQALSMSTSFVVSKRWICRAAAKEGKSLLPKRNPTAWRLFLQPLDRAIQRIAARVERRRSSVPQR